MRGFDRKNRGESRREWNGRLVERGFALRRAAKEGRRKDSVVGVSRWSGI